MNRLNYIKRLASRAREKYVLEILEDTRDRYSTWPHLQAFLRSDLSTVDQKKQFRSWCVRVAQANAREGQLVQRFLIVGTAIFNVAIFATLIFWTANSNSWMFVTALWLTFLVEYSVLASLAASGAVKVTLGLYVVGSVLCGVIAVNLYGDILPGREVDSFASGVIISTYSNTLVPLVLVGIAVAAFMALRAVVDSRRLRKYPSLVVFAELQVLTQMLVTDKRSLSDMGLQNEINERLERAAICLQKGVPRAVSLSTPSATGIFQLRLDRAAACFRGYQLWVALPRPDTREVLTSEIAQACVHFSAGLYDLLPESDVPVLGARDYASSAGKVFRGLAAGIFPLFILWGVRHFGLMPSGVLGSSLAVAATIWAVISVVGLIDPLYSGKVAALKEVMSILTRGK